LFVDHQLRISRFTPAATQVINLIHHDVGRPIEHVVTNLVGYETLVEDLRKVLDTLQPQESEVQTKGGAWYLMRIRPYRTMENVIEGAVVTFVDISERKRAEISLRNSEARYHAIFHQAFAGIAQIDLAGRLLFVNEQFCKMLDYTRDELKQLTYEDLTHPDERKHNNELFDILVGGGPDFTVKRRLLRKGGAPLWVTNSVTGIRDATGNVESIVAVSVVLEHPHEPAQ